MTRPVSRSLHALEVGRAPICLPLSDADLNLTVNPNSKPQAGVITQTPPIPVLSFRVHK